MGLLERISARAAKAETRNSVDAYIQDYIIPASFGFGGVQYPFGGGGNGLVQTLAGQRAAEVANTLPGYLSALRTCPPAFAAQLVRAMVLSQARFVFRNPPWHNSTPRRTFGTGELRRLEAPWPNATTGELITRMEWHEGLTGNAFVTRRPDRLRVLRPDWVAIVYGSELEPDDPGHAIDGDLLGYVYVNQGFGGQYKPRTILPKDMAHWAPLPDPQNAGVGMSWITPAIREIQKDRMATTHTIKYFEQGATPNLVVKGIPAAKQQDFDDIVESLKAQHEGLGNAYKTLYLTAGADATIIGNNLSEIDMKSVNGSSETRIAMLSRVHPTILAAAEGLSGSSLNAGNFGMARRIWADSWIYPTLQDLAASLAPLVNVPNDAELWTDTTDMPILREDAKDAAEIVQIQASTIVSLAQGGFTPESSIAATVGQDMGQLKPIPGWVSVQLQKADPAAQPPPGGDGGVGPKALRSAEPDTFDDLTGEPDEHTGALIQALVELDAQWAQRAWDPSKHLRNPKGPGGGRFRSMVDRLKDAIEAHAKGKGDGHPFDGFNREQLRRVAKARGVDLKRGEDRDSIAKKLLDSLHSGDNARATKWRPISLEDARILFKRVSVLQKADGSAGQISLLTVDKRGGSRDFNPTEPRDPEGKWSKVGAAVKKAVKDALDLAGRIGLDKGETLESSGAIHSSEENALSVVYAVTDSPGGRLMRLGTVYADDVTKWRGANRGGTVKLDARRVGELRESVLEADKAGKVAAKKLDVLYDSGQGHLVTADMTVAYERRIAGADWGDLIVVGETTDGDPTGWQVTLAVVVGVDDNDRAEFDPRAARKLVRQLGDAMAGGG